MKERATSTLAAIILDMDGLMLDTEPRDDDAEAIAAIYAPFVENTAISF